MAKLKNRRSLARSLGFLARGMTVQEASREIRRRYHPNISLAEVESAYFPNWLHIRQMEGRPRKDIVKTLAKLKAQSERSSKTMTRLHKNPAFAKAHAARARNIMARLHEIPVFAETIAKKASETITRLNKEAKFAKANAERSRQRMAKLNANPEFARAHAERSRKTLKRLRRDPTFNKKVVRALTLFWEKYRQEKAEAVNELFPTMINRRKWRELVSRNNPETLALLAEQHAIISNALSRLPPLHQAVITNHFDLDHKVPEKHVQAANALQPEQRLKIFQRAMKSLTRDAQLRKISE